MREVFWNLGKQSRKQGGKSPMMHREGEDLFPELLTLALIQFKEYEHVATVLHIVHSLQTRSSAAPGQSPLSVRTHLVNI